MPRKICVGNGNLLINFDDNLNIRDLYYPYIGMENHVSGHYCRFGVWIDGAFSWIDDSWEKRLGYKKESLVTQVSLKKRDFHTNKRVIDVSDAQVAVKVNE